jgi:hypothetical protein
MRNYYIDVKKLLNKNNKKTISGGSLNLTKNETMRTNSFVGKTFNQKYPMSSSLTIAGGCSSSPCLNFKYKNKKTTGGKIRLIT